MGEEPKTNVNNKIIVISLIILLIITAIYCILIFLDKTIPINVDISGFKTDKSEKICKIESIDEFGNNYKIYGKLLDKDIKTYEIYIQVKNPNEKPKYFRTQIDINEKDFISVIRKKYINENSEFSIVYMCDKEKILIESNKNIGGKDG